MAFINPLDLETLLLSILSGTPFIFYILGIIFVFMVAGYFKMPNGAIILFAIIFSVITLVPGFESSSARIITFIATLIVSIAAYYSIKNIVSR